MIKAFGIFEGGGAKGLAHVGASHAAIEDAGVEFVGFAGSSAGSIVAALLAAGYAPTKLFDPDGPENESVFDDDFIKMFGKLRWQGFRLARWITDLRQGRFTGPPVRIGQIVAILIAVVGVIFIGGRAIDLSWYCIVGILLLFGAGWYLFNSKFPLGVLSTQEFEDWLDGKLRTMLGNVNASDRVQFRHFDIPLKIIATDLISREPVVLERGKFPDFEVAKAVRASMAIPGVFTPLIDGKRLLVDGGVLSNFPAWVFDNEREASGELISIIGFRLLTPKSDPDNRKLTVARFVLDLGKVFFGDNPLQIRAIEDLHLIGIRVTARTLDFDMDRNGRIHLFNEGHRAAVKYFRDEFIGPKHAEEIKQLLRQIHGDISGMLSVGDAHLRVNIAVPIERARDTLRILYSYNMDEDPDDQLRLKIGAGAIGECWTIQRPVLVDMKKARKEFKARWKMNKYQQAHVRSKLKTLLSVPIRAANWKTGDDPIAILSIDSDNDLLTDFFEVTNTSSPLFIYLEAATKRIASALRR